MTKPKDSDQTTPAKGERSQEEQDEAFREHLRRLGAVETEVEDTDAEEDAFWLETLGGGLPKRKDEG